MLKVEKIARTDQIKIFLRAKQPLLTTPLLLAFGYALFAHLAVLCLFQISQLKITGTQTLFPQVNVAVDIPKHLSILATDVAFNADPVVPEYLLTKELQLPQLPNPFDAIPLWQPGERHLQKHLLDSVAYYSQDFEFNDDHNKDKIVARGESPSFSIFVSGPIAELSWELMDMNQEYEYLKNQDEGIKKSPYVRLQYSVNVDMKSGCICWWQSTEEGSIDDILLGVELLKAIRFSSPQELAFLPGNVDIYLNNRLFDGL